MKTGHLIAHQGDCGLRVAVLTTAEKRKLHAMSERLTLLKGETTGHAHVLVAEHIKTGVFNGLQVIVIGERAAVIHEEHDAIELDPGTYAVWTPREYDGEDERRVTD